jgi:hypothetical protein
MRRVQRWDGKGSGQRAALAVPRCSPAAGYRLLMPGHGISEVAFLAQETVSSAYHDTADRLPQLAHVGAMEKGARFTELGASRGARSRSGCSSGAGGMEAR